MKKFWYIIAAVLLFAVIAWGVIYAMNMNNQQAAAPEASSSPASSPDSSASPSSDSADTETITYSDSGFSPASVTVKSGSKITVKNSSSSTTIDFSSDPHPVHTDNPELNAGDIEPGSSKTFTVTTTGDWGFHDHHNPAMNGTIIVQ